MNALDPNRMTAEERLDEVAQILSFGFLRWRQKQAKKSEKTEKVSLDLSPKQSVHVSETNDTIGDKP